MNRFSLFAPEGIPEIAPGDSLADLLLERFRHDPLQDGDILVITHKIVSKAEGRVVKLSEVTPEEAAQAYARRANRDPRLMQVILEESKAILSCEPGGPVLCLHNSGIVCANAGVDISNGMEGCVILLPKDPDASARAIRKRLEQALGLRLGVLICDTQGRAFRNAACGVAIGASGVAVMKSYIGAPDRRGRVMRSSVEGMGDELAAAATLLMGQGREGLPVAVIRGYAQAIGEGTAAELIRPGKSDILLRALAAPRKE